MMQACKVVEPSLICTRTTHHSTPHHLQVYEQVQMLVADVRNLLCEELTTASLSSSSDLYMLLTLLYSLDLEHSPVLHYLQTKWDAINAKFGAATDQYRRDRTKLWLQGAHSLTLIKTEYWDRAGGGGNISYDW